jgi:hypothetical protein
MTARCSTFSLSAFEALNKIMANESVKKTAKANQLYLRYHVIGFASVEVWLVVILLFSVSDL